MQRLIPVISLTICLLTILSACTESGTAVIQDKQDYTIEDQVVIGDHLVVAIKNDPTKYDILNANVYGAVYDYLNTMLRSAVITEQVVMRKDFEWEIIPMLDNREAYVYSMPGGKVVISTGMLQFLEDEAELLALLSCEIYYADVDLHTEAMKDQFSGIRLGSILLGSDTKSPDDLIDFLKNQMFTEEEVAAADRRAIEVMCPFNYDVNSIVNLVERTNASIDMLGAWKSKRPRPANWSEVFFTEIEKCTNLSDRTFRTRYESIKAQLPQ